MEAIEIPALRQGFAGPALRERSGRALVRTLAAALCLALVPFPHAASQETVPRESQDADQRERAAPSGVVGSERPRNRKLPAVSGEPLPEEAPGPGAGSPDAARDLALDLPPIAGEEVGVLFGMMTGDGEPYSLSASRNETGFDVVYPSLLCGGSWTVLSRTGNVVRLRETITFGLDRCIAEGIATVEFLGEGRAVLEWRESEEADVLGRAELTVM